MVAERGSEPRTSGLWAQYASNVGELCKIYAKTPSRPVVGLSMATKFNEKVAMNLKQWNSRWIMHIIGMWSRYTISIFIDRNKPSHVIDTLMTHYPR